MTAAARKHLDGCEIDFAEYADEDEETQMLRVLFPDGDPSKAEEWHALFGGDTADAS